MKMRLMTRKTQLLLFLLLMFMLHVGSACNIESYSIIGSGTTATEERSVKSFIALKVSGGIEVELTQSDTESLVITADDNVLPLIESVVSDGVLRIRLKESVRNAGTMKALVSFRKLESIDISGAVKLKGTNPMTFQNIDLESSGASEIRLDINATSIKAKISGASSLSVRGKSAHSRVDASGASRVYASDMETQTTSIDASGASIIEVWATEKINADASGASSIRYKGKPGQLQRNTSGASSVSPF
jgi:hypothetical protein